MPALSHSDGESAFSQLTTVCCLTPACWLCNGRIQTCTHDENTLYGADYNETFNPVVRLVSVRTQMQYPFNVDSSYIMLMTAFLSGFLHEEEYMYMKQPNIFIKRRGDNLVGRLKKSVYGLKQSSRCWNTALHSCHQEMSFTQSSSDPCVYMSSGDVFYIGVEYMNLVAPTEQNITEVKCALSRRVDIKDLRKLHYFLSIAVKQDEEQGCAWIGQPSYTRNLLERFEMQDCKPVTTPTDASVKLQKASDEDELVDEQLLQSAIGRLMYLSLYTRPDIAYVIGNLEKL